MQVLKSNFSQFYTNNLHSTINTKLKQFLKINKKKIIYLQEDSTIKIILLKHKHKQFSIKIKPDLTYTAKVLN